MEGILIKRNLGWPELVHRMDVYRLPRQLIYLLNWAQKQGTRNVHILDLKMWWNRT